VSYVEFGILPSSMLDSGGGGGGVAEDSGSEHCECELLRGDGGVDGLK
jgi:hypothetical protein